MDYTTRTSCRICGSHDLVDLFSLGEQVVSDFIHYGDPVLKCPIDIILCRNCTLVQQRHTARQDFLYSRHYWYRSGATQKMRDALKNIAGEVEALVDLHPEDNVLDIGSNDGTLLRSYTKPCRKVGFEPATNLQEVGREGVDTLVNEFWSYEAYQSVCDGFPVKAITAIGMFYDLEDPNQFIADVAKTLDHDGVFIAQLMTLRNMIVMNDVGNLAHEHLEFYSVRSLKHLLEKHGLEIFSIETNDTNGQSDRFYICKKGMRSIESDVKDRINLEYSMMLTDPRIYQRIFEDWNANRTKCRKIIIDAVNSGKMVSVYGASTKGNVILQFLGLNSNHISGARDASPEKWGRYTAGTNIRIISPERFKAEPPDYFLILPYAFSSEFISQEKEFRDNGGQFIIPFPEVKVV